MNKKIVLENLENIPNEYKKIRSSIKLTIIICFITIIIMFIISSVLIIKQTSKVYILDSESSHLLSGSMYNDNDTKVISYEIDGFIKQFINLFFNLNKLNYKQNANAVVYLGSERIRKEIDLLKTNKFYDDLERYNVFQQSTIIGDIKVNTEVYPFMAEADLELRLVGDISSYNITKNFKIIFKISRLNDRTKKNPHKLFINDFQLIEIQK